jgi:hypothetical protein
MYHQVHISKITSFEKFCNHLHSADKKWDSIRRIPYSTPGRWVLILDLSDLPFTSQSDTLLLDSLLTVLFPLLPFLAHFAINPSFALSRRAATSLALRENSINIRALEGITHIHTLSSTIRNEHHLVQILRHCPNLEQLEVIGQGFDPVDLEATSEIQATVLPDSFTPLHLPHLHTLTLVSMPSSPVLLSLLHSTLPSLRKLTITPYDNIPPPASRVSEFITTHGQPLRSLLLFTPKTWPTRLHSSPHTLLHTSPNLRHLSLEIPCPEITLPLPESPGSAISHPLEILSIPRPTAEFWKILERLLPHLPSLSAVRARDVRWLRRGISSPAQSAGVQGELKEWTRRLARRGVNVLDADYTSWTKHVSGI